MAIGLSIYHHAPSQILIFQCLIIFGYPAVSHVETNPNTACFVIFDPAIPPIWDWFYSHSLRQTPIFNWFKGPLTFKDPSLKESSESKPPRLHVPGSPRRPASATGQACPEATPPPVVEGPKGGLKPI